MCRVWHARASCSWYFIFFLWPTDTYIPLGLGLIAHGGTGFCGWRHWLRVVLSSAACGCTDCPQKPGLPLPTSSLSEFQVYKKERIQCTTDMLATFKILGYITYGHRDIGSVLQLDWPTAVHGCIPRERVHGRNVFVAQGQIRMPNASKLR